MGFTSKITFLMESIEVAGSVFSFAYDFAIFTSSDFWNLNFISVSESVLQNGRPKITWLVEGQFEFATSPDQALLIIDTDTTGQSVGDFWVGEYLALKFASGAIVLVRTFKGAWMSELEDEGNASSPVTGRNGDTANAANYEYRIVQDNTAGPSTTLGTGPVSMAVISSAEYSTNTVPAVFGERSLPAFSVFGDFITRFSQQDIDLIPSDSTPETLTETARFTLRYDKRILDRSRFTYEGNEFNVNRIDVFDRGRKLSLEGIRQIERVVTA